MSWFSSKSPKLYANLAPRSSPVCSGKLTLLIWLHTSPFLQVQAFQHVRSLFIDTAHFKGMSLLLNSLRLAFPSQSQPVHYCLIISGVMLSTLEYEDALDSNQLKCLARFILLFVFPQAMKWSSTAFCGQQNLGNGFSIYVNQMQFFFLLVLNYFTILFV